MIEREGGEGEGAGEGERRREGGVEGGGGEQVKLPTRYLYNTIIYSQPPDCLSLAYPLELESFVQPPPQSKNQLKCWQGPCAFQYPDAFCGSIWIESFAHRLYTSTHLDKGIHTYTCEHTYFTVYVLTVCLQECMY